MRVILRLRFMKFLIPLFLFCFPLVAEEKEKEKAPAPEPVSAPSITHSKLKVDDLAYAYQAEAGRIALKDDAGEETAQVFYVAYTVDGDAKDSERPVTFCFNGGPGSSAVWLHLGAMGPKRVVIPNDGTGFPEPPFKLVANPHCPLPDTDIVLVDPVSTGYSTAADPQKAGDQFHGFDQDIDSMAEFIRLWVTKNKRWDSPKYLMGESYGAIRVCGVASRLQDRYGMYLNGLMLVSGVLDFGTILQADGNDRPYSLFFPRMTAVAGYHKQLAPELQKDLAATVERSREFAATTLTEALHAGSSYPAEKRAAVVKEMAALTGLTPELIDRLDLRVSPSLFRKQLLLDEGQLVGRFDGRVTGSEREPASSTAYGDPSWDNVYGAFATTMNTYLREELGYEEERTYEILNWKLGGWDYGSFENRFVTVASSIEDIMVSNPHLRILVMCGNQDLATPPEAMEYSLNQLTLPESARENIQYTYYEGGHMMYTHPKSLQLFGEDVRKFVKE
jgi:carboxypeptidase C (cathepsin A)